jgi:hypothetical protein
MILITDVTEANILLEKYNKSFAQICMFSLTHKKMALKLVSPTNSKVVFIVGIACENLNGSFTFQDADMFIRVTESHEENSYVTEIKDKQGRFHLVTSGGFSVALGQEYEFGTTFDGFLC